MEKFDVIVAGGGIAGMAAAAAFGSLGLNTACIDPVANQDGTGAAKTDLRSTALLRPSRDFLARIGLWQRLEDVATALKTMRIKDASGAEHPPAVTRDFNAADIEEDAFGWNVPNRVLRQQFTEHLSDLPQVTHLTGEAVAHVSTRTLSATVQLASGDRLSARLLVAADGRNSLVRRSLRIPVKTLRYGQSALAFTVSHPEPHHNISTEVHRSGGPFTLVPLPDHEGSPASAVVWMERAPEAQRLMALDEDAFNAACTDRSALERGPLTLVGGRSLWPIISQLADRFSSERVALVAEAAHVVPPIGAQGLNMSLADISALYQHALENPDQLGDAKSLTAFDRARRRDAQIRFHGIDVLNRISMARFPAMQAMRAKALATLHDVAPVRTRVMQLGLGVSRA